MDWDKKWLVDFNARKSQLVLFDLSNNNGSIDVKMDGSVLEDRGSYIISIAKTACKKVGALIRFMKFLSLEVALHFLTSR